MRGCACLLGCLGMGAAVQAEVTDAFLLKSRFLTGFVGYVGFPDRDSEAPAVLGVYGSEAFLKVLEQTCAHARSRGRKVVARSVEPGDSLENVSVLFISRDAAEDWLPLVEAARREHVLLVGDEQGFLNKGGMIEFRLRHSRLLFSIDVANAETAQLHLSSKLSRIAIR